jgi:hypothetical protein
MFTRDANNRDSDDNSSVALSTARLRLFIWRLRPAPGRVVNRATDNSDRGAMFHVIVPDSRTRRGGVNPVLRDKHWGKEHAWVTRVARRTRKKTSNSS